MVSQTAHHESLGPRTAADPVRTSTRAQSDASAISHGWRFIRARRTRPRPNAGAIHYPAGTGFPLLGHDFAQVWYALEGECRLGDRQLRAGDLVYHADPHVEQEMFTQGGCTMLFVQYQGPIIGARPIYERRFDADASTAKSDMDLTR